MNSEPTASYESLRQEDILSYDILDTQEEKQFNELVELAALICNCPIASISFVDDKRQWFKARKNLNFAQTSRDISFCSQTIRGNDVMIIPNATIDARFNQSPLVIEKKYGFMPAHLSAVLQGST